MNDYNKMVSKNAPKTKMLPTMLLAFIVGGIICMIGEGFFDLYKTYFTNLTEDELRNATSMTMIFIGVTLTAFGLYDKIGYYAGAGSIIPITGFANSVMSPAMEYNREGIVYGICCKIFAVAGPIIVFGVTSSVIIGLVGLAL